MIYDDMYDELSRIFLNILTNVIFAPNGDKFAVFSSNISIPTKGFYFDSSILKLFDGK